MTDKEVHHTCTKQAVTTTSSLEDLTMAKNPPVGDGHRIGAVRNRSQVYNPQNNRWTKRDPDTGQFMDQKSDEKPFKGVRKEK